MKRLSWGIFSVLFLAIIAVVTGGVAPAHAADLNNFRIETFDIQYELSRDSEGRSVLKTTETITAQFPVSNQNHGIERAIPHEYNGHSTSLTIQSVTAGPGGQDYPYTTYASGNDVTVLRIGDADTYVYGQQVYTIEYTQRDVTRYYENTGKDEWYWDTNGTGWQVPIDTLSISVSLDDALKEQLSDWPVCYEGYTRDTTQCELIKDATGAYTVVAQNLGTGENVTVAFGFPAETFSPYQKTWLESFMGYWIISQFVTLPVAIVLLTALGISYGRRYNRTKEQNPIAVEYIPPKEASVLVSSQVISTSHSVLSAQLIDLAVRHYIEIVQTKEKGLWHSAEYDIVIAKSVTTLRAEEKEILTDMYGKTPNVGERLSLKKLRTDTWYSVRTSDNDKKLAKLIEGEYAIRAKSPETKKFFVSWARIVLIIGLVMLSIPLLVSAFVFAVQGWTIRPLTDRGLLLRRYILGLKEYVQAAEVDRIKFLQGPDTAERVGYSVDPAKPGDLVKLYERVLPYAILFGYEKEWAKQLGDIYAQTESAPQWYHGNAAFNAVVFASAMQNFSQAASYAGGSSSSSGGGSSGGGSSGGGGGGGGGGGW